MAVIKVDCIGKGCPTPLLEMAMLEAIKGDTIELMDGFGADGTYIEDAQESMTTLIV